jgi:hypothetical protein
MNILKNIPPFHPLLFVLFPLLSLYSANLNNLTLGDILPTILLVLLFSLMVWAAFFILIRDLSRSAIATSLVLFAFFSFAHSLTAISEIAELMHSYEKIRTLVETRNGMLFLFFIEALLVAATIFYISHLKNKLTNLTKIYNFMSIVLIFIIMFTLTSNLFNQNRAQAGSTPNPQSMWEKDLQPIDTNKRDLPDIYYIILDGYGRSDILEDIYDLNNEDFISFLESKGFYIAQESRANYSQTGLSLTSSLNLTYLDELSQQVGRQSANLSPIKANIEDNLVFYQLRQAGYTVVSFSSGYILTDINTADQFLASQKTPDSFQNILINNTPLSMFLLGKQYDWHRQRINYAFQMLPEISQENQPTIVFAHILAPHPPFVFGPNGETINPPRKYGIHDGSHFMEVANREEYVDGYRDQLTYITEATKNVIERILDNSSTQPVIIIQGDHGPGSLLDHENLEQTNLGERMSILNAYLMSEVNSDLLYPNITPVNSFRLLFNAYLGTNYSLLEDRSYFSTIDQPFQFTDVTSRLDN